MMYRIVAGSLQIGIWGGELMGAQNLPEHGPAVLVGNHLGALGPIAVAACVPRRLYPWVVSDMMDRRAAAEYLRIDFIEKSLTLKQPVSGRLSAALSKITVPLLRSVGCVPVYSDPERRNTTLSLSVELLARNQIVLIFPEDPLRPADPQLGMAPFKKGFTRLGELLFARNGSRLRFYPLAVDATERVVQLGTPVTYIPNTVPAAERLRIKTLLERTVHEMLLALRAGPFLGVTLPQ